MSLFTELKRRNVIRVAIAYIAGAWLLTEVSGTLFPVFGIPDWGVRFIVIVLALGFLPALIISWAYELTPEGLKRERDVGGDASITHLTAKRLDWITIGLIVVALAFILADRLWLDKRLEGTPGITAVKTDNEQPQQPASTEPQFPPNSIAVLPFVNMSDDAANEYFSDGISEELLNLLAKIPELRVIARTSSFAYKGKDIQITDVARELNVGHVLEGSVRKAGNQVRITAQLIRTSDSSHLWSETYDRSLENIFAIQDEIADAVVRQLRIKLLGETPKAFVVDPEAYALLLQARHFGNLGTAAGTQQAGELLQQVLAIAPDYSAAWSELGRNWQNKVSVDLLGEEEGYKKSSESQNRALELDPDNAVAYSRLGHKQLHHEKNLPAAAKLFKKALALEPGNAVVLANAASLAMTLGRFKQAIAIRELAQQVDPLSSANSSGLGRSYFYDGQLDKAETTYRKTLLLSPNRPVTRAMLSWVLAKKGDPDNLEELRDLIANEPLEPLRLVATASTHYMLGNVAESDSALNAMIEKYSGKTDKLIALVYAIRGEPDETIKWLQRAVETEGPQTLVPSWYSPSLSILHGDPRWEKLLADAGLSEQQLAAIDFDFKLPE